MFQIVSNRLRRAASLPASLAFRATNSQPLFDRIERRHGMMMHRTPPSPHLDTAESDIVAALEQNGVVVSSLAALGIDPAILGHGQALARVVADRVQGLAKAPAHIESSPEDTMAHPAMYRFGLEDVLLRIARAYMRQDVAYDGAMLFHTLPDGREQGTRQWHLDREDRRMIKVALYLNDVDEEGGPFEVLHHESRRPGAPYDYRPLDTAGLEDKLGLPITAADTTVCTGPTGTVVFADTARFYHRGRPATARPRAAIFASYFARVPRHPFFCARSRLGRAQIATLTQGMSAEQKAAGHWRETLPLVARMVPPSLT